jgi:hypothetical protein
MSVVTSQTFFSAFFKTLGVLFFYIFLGLLLDSVFMVENYQDLQWFANLLMVLVFSITFFKGGPRIKEQMLYIVLIAVIVEYTFSIGTGMYTYRLENVPHYIPMGHALVYVAVVYFTKTPYSKNNKRVLEKVFTLLIITIAITFLIFKNDVFGFVLTIATLLILRKKPRERMFYLTMFIAVSYLEIVGTAFECWWWPTTAWDNIPFLPSANPPSGISFFYFGFDLVTLWLYKKRHKIAWLRMKNIRKMRLQTLKIVN